MMKKKFLLVSFLFCAGMSFAQFQYTAAKAQNIAGTYTDLDSGTVISTGGNFDNANSAVQNIGFNFYFNRRNFTEFILSTNGFIKLGNSAPATNNHDVLTSADSNILAPFNYNLRAGTSTTEYRVYTSGAVGSRICKIQFENVRDVATSQYDNINFQIKLYETSNIIEFVYGSFIPSGAAPAFKEMIVGIKGSDSTFSVNATKSSAVIWSSATFINGVYPNPNTKFNNRNETMYLPDVGRTFRFTPVSDAKVEAVYTMGKIPQPIGVYNHVVSAKIINLGGATLFDYPVTLSITGANTISNVRQITLPPNDTMVMSFDPVSPWSIGTNTVTVSVPSDDLNTNNSASYQQVVNDSVFSYADASSPAGAAGFNTNEGVMLAHFYARRATILITGVRVHINNNAANVGKTVRGAVGFKFSSDYTYSNPYVITAGDLGTYKTFTFNQPVRFFSDIGGDANFVAGLYQAPSVLGFNPVSYQTEGPPSRPNVFYKHTTGGSYQDFTQGRLMIEAIGKVDTTFPSLPVVDLLVWNLSEINSPDSAAATTYHPLLVSSNKLTRGATAPASPGTNSFMTTGFKNDGISTSNTDYFQFKLTPGAGDTMSLSGIYFAVNGDPDFNVYPTGVNSQFAYSLNGTTFTLIHSPINSNDGEHYVFLDDIPALQNITGGTTVTMRYYASGSNATGAWGFSSSNIGLQIQGTIRNQMIIAAPVAPVGADYYLATCSSTATGSVSFISRGTFAPGNIYTAKINTTMWSNDTSALVVGSLASNANSGTINITIPAGIPERIVYPYYQIWIESSSAPLAVSIPSGYFKVKRNGYCQNANSYFRSKQTGNWNNVTTWEISGDKITWYASTLIPDKQAHSVEIRQPDTVTLTIPVGTHSMKISGKLKIVNGGANNGSLTFYKNLDNSITRNLTYTMLIDTTGILQVVSSAVYDSVIRRGAHNNSGAQWIRNFGTITIGDGSGTNADGFYSFANRPYDITFYDESVFEWNSTSSFGPASNMTYFGPNYRHPTLRLTKMPAASFGSASNTIVNGTLEVNTPVIMDSSGIKEFRDGIEGTSVLTQAAGSGEFRTVSPYTEIPVTDTSGGLIGILRGNLTVNLNSQGLTLANGVRVKDNADVLIVGSGVSNGKIEVEPLAKMTLDPASVLTIQNADLSNYGQINGTGKIQFTGTDTSKLRSTGIINAKLELLNKQLRLDGNATTSSIDLLGGSHLRLDSFHLNMRTGNLLGDSSNFIVTNDTGRLVRYVASAEVPFHIGVNDTSYTPVTITNIGTPDNFKVRVAPGVYNGGSITSGNCDRTWFITDSLQGGSNVKLKMQWRTAYEQPGFLRTNSYVSNQIVCPPPINCSGAYFDFADPGTATSVAPNYWTMERSGINNFNTNAFIVTSTPFIYTFTGNGNWSDPANWTPGIAPPRIISAGMEVIINPAGAGQCISNGDIIIQPGGKVTVLPGKIFRVTTN